MLLIHYKCPKCFNEWDEEYECACDSTCPACECDDITAWSWEPIPRTYQLTLQGYDVEICTPENEDKIRWVTAPDWPALFAFLVRNPHVVLAEPPEVMRGGVAVAEDDGVDVVLNELGEITKNVSNWRVK